MSENKENLTKFLFDELIGNIFINFNKEIINEVIFVINKNEEYYDNEVKKEKKYFSEEIKLNLIDEIINKMKLKLKEEIIHDLKLMLKDDN